MMDLSPKYRAILLGILREHLRTMSVSVFVFGSRVRSSHRADSDLDLLIEAREAIPLAVLGRLKEAFEESDLPFRVDVVDRAAISPAFYQRIRDELRLLCTFSGAAEVPRLP
jgi:predicted nucleotidyltransferase